MNILIDLRFGIPPLINLFIYLIIFFPAEDGNRLSLFYFHQNPPVHTLALFLFLFFCLLVLCVSLKLPLDIPPIPPRLNLLRLKPGEFSVPLSLSLLASLLFPPYLFWGFLAMLAALSSGDGFLWKRLAPLVCRVMSAIPTIFVTFALSDGHPPETPDPPTFFATETVTELEIVEIQP